jgi:hypothetical protein
MSLLNASDLKGIMDVLGHMEMTETVVAGYYRACGEVYLQHQAFWFGIAEQENKHAFFIQKMKAIIEKKPEHFEKGRPFNIMAALTLIKGLEASTTKVRYGQVPLINALAIARDNEQAFMEAKYNEVVKTDDIEYQTLVNEIITDTIAHKGHIENMFAELRK